MNNHAIKEFTQKKKVRKRVFLSKNEIYEEKVECRKPKSIKIINCDSELTSIRQISSPFALPAFENAGFMIRLPGRD
jgi:hypothetical protein